MNSRRRPVEIIPAIIGRDFTEVQQRFEQLTSLVDWVSLDILDGKFAPSESWREPDDLKLMAGRIKIETHLMVVQPERRLNQWLAVADRLMIHYESTEVLEDILTTIGASGRQAGLVLLLETPLAAADQFIELVDVIQLMSIAQIGYQGQPFDGRALDRLKILRRRWPDVIIEIDGGVDFENAAELIEAGADNLIVGSAIWQSGNPAAALAEFRRLAAAAC